MEKIIITIGRQFGSGGREFGKKLAEQLHIAYYDKELLNKAAAGSGLANDFLEYYDEKTTSSLLFTLATSPAFMSDMIGNRWGDMAEKATREAILDVAKDSCVIVGRHADYTLRQEKHLLRIFVTSDKESRISRVMKRDVVTMEEAERKIQQMDKARANSYSYHTGMKWGAADHYDLCLNLSKIGIEKAVKMVMDYLN